MAGSGRIPKKSAKINGRIWRLVTSQQVYLNEDTLALGVCDHADRTIYLMKGPLHQLQDTLFHEMVHASCPSLTEEQVTEVERGVYAFLAENPVLRDWMFAKTENAKKSD
jgi:hypothetical protein